MLRRGGRRRGRRSPWGWLPLGRLRYLRQGKSRWRCLSCRTPWLQQISPAHMSRARPTSCERLTPPSLIIFVGPSSSSPSSSPPSPPLLPRLLLLDFDPQAPSLPCSEPVRMASRHAPRPSFESACPSVPPDSGQVASLGGRHHGLAGRSGRNSAAPGSLPCPCAATHRDGSQTVMMLSGALLSASSSADAATSLSVAALAVRGLLPTPLAVHAHHLRRKPDRPPVGEIVQVCPLAPGVRVLVLRRHRQAPAIAGRLSRAQMLLQAGGRSSDRRGGKAREIFMATALCWQLTQSTQSAPTGCGSAGGCRRAPPGQGCLAAPRRPLPPTGSATSVGCSSQRSSSSSSEARTFPCSAAAGQQGAALVDSWPRARGHRTAGGARAGRLPGRPLAGAQLSVQVVVLFFLKYWC